METVNLIELTKDIKDQHKNFVVSNINSHCLRIAVFTGEYDWHYHSNSDELFIVLEGELLIDFEDGETAVLKPNDSILIPACKIHRTRALKRTVNLCFEHIEADTIKSGAIMKKLSVVEYRKILPILESHTKTTTFAYAVCDQVIDGEIFANEN